MLYFCFTFAAKKTKGLQYYNFSNTLNSERETKSGKIIPDQGGPMGGPAGAGLGTGWRRGWGTGWGTGLGTKGFLNWPPESNCGMGWMIPGSHQGWNR